MKSTGVAFLAFAFQGVKWRKNERNRGSEPRVREEKVTEIQGVKERN